MNVEKPTAHIVLCNNTSRLIKFTLQAPAIKIPKIETWHDASRGNRNMGATLLLNVNVSEHSLVSAFYIVLTSIVPFQNNIRSINHTHKFTIYKLYTFMQVHSTTS